MPEENGKQNPNESYIKISKEYQRNCACSYGYKLECVDDKFSKHFKSYLGEDAVYNYINSMVEGDKYFSDLMKKRFNKEFVMTKKDDENVKNSAYCWICVNSYVDGDVRVRDHCHIIWKYRGSAHREEHGRLNFKINFVSNGLKKYMSFNISIKFPSFIASIF